MNASKIIAFSTATVLIACLAPMVASAQSSTNPTTACESSVLGSGVKKATTVAQVIALGDCQIAARDVSLGNATTRVNGMQKVSTAQKATLLQNIQNTEAALATIKTKLDADTVLATAKTDYRTIFTTVRVYELVIPQTYIEGASDREQTIAATLQQIETELQTRNASASATVQTENAPFFSDMTTKLADAVTQATNALNDVANLVPDNGNAQVQASNKAAIQNARTATKAARTDFTAILKDVQQIRKNLGVSSTVGSTTAAAQ